MTKVIGLSALLAVGVWAQSSAQQPAAPAASPTSRTTIQGCLTGSEGNFVLTQNNTSSAFKLVGSETQLKNNIGREISATGQMVNAADNNPDKPRAEQNETGKNTPDTTSPTAPSSDGKSSTTMGTNALQVTEVRIISDECGTTP